MENQIQIQSQPIPTLLEKWQRGVTNSISAKNYLSGKILLSPEANSLTVAQARQSGACMEYLSNWNKTELVGIISLMLTEFLSTQLSDLKKEQVLDVAETIIYSCKAWTPDDILLVLRKGRDGFYRNDNARWTMQTFNRWADAYEIERSSVEINKHISQKEYITTREETKHEIFSERKKNEASDRKDELQKMNSIIAQYGKQNK